MCRHHGSPAHLSILTLDPEPVLPASGNADAALIEGGHQLSPVYAPHGLPSLLTFVPSLVLAGGLCGQLSGECETIGTVICENSKAVLIRWNPLFKECRNSAPQSLTSVKRPPQLRDYFLVATIAVYVLVPILTGDIKLKPTASL